MPKPQLNLDARHPPSVGLETLGKSLFNLFPLWDMRLFGKLDSTSSEARRVCLTLGGAAWPRVFLADYQTAGRGRQDRRWVAPEGTSLLATMSLPLGGAPSPHSTLPLRVGTWLLEAFERLGCGDVSLKWPNDVLIGGRKAAGILCETAGDAMLIGVGVNIGQGPDMLPPRDESVPQATSVRIALGDHYSGWLGSALTLMSTMLESLEHPSDASHALGTYRGRCDSIGKRVRFVTNRGGAEFGCIEAISDMGTLMVRSDAGTVREVAGEVEFVPGLILP